MALDVGGVAGDRHEVLDLADAVRREEASDQDVRVGEVELLDRARGSPAEREVAAVTVVEDRGEHARRVEPRAAVPVDRPVGADQGGGSQIADQAVVGDRRIASGSLGL